MRKKVVYLVILSLFLSSIAAINPVKANGSVTITDVVQRPWIIDDGGDLKSETMLTIDNQGDDFEAWVKVKVTGKNPYIQSLGTVESGVSNLIVNVLELKKDGDYVTFEIYNNAKGNGEAVAIEKRPQKKVRHWKVYVAHDIHMDLGYTEFQEDLNNRDFPGFLDDAFKYIEETNEWDKDNQFKYPVETSYMIHESTWNSRDASWNDKLKKHLAEGRVTYPSSYLNQVYAGMGTEELARINYFSERFLKDKLGVSSNKVLYKSDDPGFSWAAVDVMVNSGINYLMLRQNPDPITPYPKLFYYQGRNVKNKLLTYNYGHYSTDEMDFKNPDASIPFNNLTSKIMNYHSAEYPYDAIIADFTTPYDNKGITSAVKDNIKAINDRKDSQGRDYVYPKVINSTVNDFFEYIEGNFNEEIPTYKGNMENWWNYGVASTAYETGINKENHDKLPAAEFFSTIANISVPDTKYPYKNIFDAYNNMILFDEHTWGSQFQQPDEQWNWKRNTAITSSRLTDQLLNDSLTALSTQIPTTDDTIVVYNSLSLERSDIVTVSQEGLPKHFEITDIDTGETVKYQKQEDGNIVFVAENVPSLGYKSFRVTPRKDDPTFNSSLLVTDNTMENDFYKVTFDSSGAISSILDKKKGNIEMVDSNSPYKMNEFVYYTTKKMSHDVYTTHTVNSSNLIGKTGAVMGTMSADGTTAGVSEMKRKVILYDSIPRIDIVNEVNKREAPSYGIQDEEGFFVFPLNMPNFRLEHEMPSGDVRPYVDSDISNPKNEQFYGSSTAYYTVNRWIDTSNQKDYGITLSPISSPIVQYGERRSALGPWDYNMKNPWIYSFVFNNKWHVNFQESQPGPVTFKYSLTSHSGKDWKAGRADKFGMKVSNPLQAKVINGAQTGGNFDESKGSFISVDSNNVVLTTAKLAEANGEGIILRFNETLGKTTRVTVDLSFLSPASVSETDIVENNLKKLILKDNKVSFTIDGHGWKTIRVKNSKEASKVENVHSRTDSNGTLIEWDSVKDNNLSYYEVFRDTSKDFTPGSGNYIASVSTNHYFDEQVSSQLEKTYYYKVRTVNAGMKSEGSTSSSSYNDQIVDNSPPSTPTNLLGHVRSADRVSISWEPSIDNVNVEGYKIYRNGKEIMDVENFYNSFLDTTVESGGNYNYTVKSYDSHGNLSSNSNNISVDTPKQSISDDNIAPLATVNVSSEYNSDYGAQKSVDGIIGVQGNGEWASKGEQKPWIQLEWAGSKIINKVKIYDRINLADNVNSGTLIFSDGSSIEISDIPHDGMTKEVSFDSKEVTWIKFIASGGTGGNVGLSEIQVFEAPNIAKDAIVSASSEYNTDYSSAKIIDGIIGVHGNGEWAAYNELNPWIQLDFENEKSINRITLYDRNNLFDNANSGILRFSDGSTIEVTGLPMDGSKKQITFTPKTIEWVRFEVTNGSGANVGLSEVEVY
jgi:chitodextrinase